MEPSSSSATAAAAAEEAVPRLCRGQSVLRKVTNPFENEAPWTAYECAKAVLVGITLLPVRIAVCLAAHCAQAGVAKLASAGMPLQNDRGCFRHQEPLGLARRLVRAPLRVTNSMFLWSLGFWRIDVDDRRRDRKSLANIVVAAPHRNLMDPFIMAAVFPPWIAGVGKADLLNIPLLCHTGVACEGIFVDRKNPDSRQACKDAIAHRAKPSWTGLPLLIFPEGTTTNGRAFIQFKLGPFSPGQPVQPVLLKYRIAHFDFSWVGKNSNMGMCILRMMLQFANFCTVTILDTYVPSEEEVRDPILFANNVRALMAEEFDVPTTEHSYDDVWFAADAVRGNVGQDFELAQVKRLYDMDLDTLKVLLKSFRKFDTDNSGTLSRAEFDKAFQLSEHRCPASFDHLFSFFDTDGSGAISYREFIQGLALLSGRCSVQSQAKLAFLIFDVEGTGQVQIDALQKALDNAVAHAGDASPGERIFEMCGREGGAVGFEEFCALVEREPGILESAISLSRQRVGTVEEAALQASDEKDKRGRARISD